MYVVRIGRLRRDAGDSIERQQSLWIGGSGIAAALLVLAFWMVPQLVTGSELLPADAIGVPGLFFVAGLTVALLRYRLFDLDALLGRTLVYSALSLVVVVIYLAAVALLAAIFSAAVDAVGGGRRRCGRDRRQSAAGRTAAPGQPPAVRRSRRPVCGAEQGRRTVDRDRRGRRCYPRWPPMSAARCGCPTCRSSGGPSISELVDFGRAPTGETRLYDVPLTFRGEHLGRLWWRPRPGRTILAGGAAAAVRPLPAGRRCGSRRALSAELQRSRERLVLAREEERRVIRRTLHDDIGPTIASIALRAETVRQLADRPAERDPMAAALAYRPRRDRGRQRCASCPTSCARRRWTIGGCCWPCAIRPAAWRRCRSTSPPPRRSKHYPVDAGDTDGTDLTAGEDLPAAVEVAAFRIAVSALNNTAHHAAATHCWIR